MTTREKAYDIVHSMIDTNWMKEIDYQKMSNPWAWVTELMSWQVFWIKFRIVFYQTWHPCAYIKLPDHSELIQILKEWWYDDLPCQVCHGWFTYWCWTPSDDWRWFEEWYWIWRDYGHLWDYTDYMKDYPIWDMRKWTTEDILIEVVEQILEFRENWYLISLN